MTDLVQEPKPTELDPEPNFFGIGRIDELVAPDGSTEYSRALLWIQQRARRLAFGAFLQSRFVGDPIAAQNIRAAWQPLIDHLDDKQLNTSDIQDDGTEPESNWIANL